MIKVRREKNWSMKVAVCKNKMNKHKWKVRNVKSKLMSEWMKMKTHEVWWWVFKLYKEKWVNQRDEIKEAWMQASRDEWMINLSAKSKQ